MLAPPEDDEEADEHAAEVGEMGDAVDNEDAHEELDGRHDDYKPTVLYGHKALAVLAEEEDEEEKEDGVFVDKGSDALQGRDLDAVEHERGGHEDEHPDEDVDAVLGEVHGESQQEAVDGSRGADGDMHAGHEEVEQSCADAASEIVEEETSCAPVVLHHGAEDPQCIHIKK